MAPMARASWTPIADWLNVQTDSAKIPESATTRLATTMKLVPFAPRTAPQCLPKVIDSSWPPSAVLRLIPWDHRTGLQGTLFGASAVYLWICAGEVCLTMEVCGIS